jgi:chromate reductase
VFLNVLTMQQPEAYIGGVQQLFDSEGRIVNEGTREFLKAFMHAYAGWVSMHVKTSDQL